MKNYQELLEKLKANHYEVSHFIPSNTLLKKQCFMRHDIDFSLEDAQVISEIEKKLDISSTFLFLPASDHYNLSSYHSRKIVAKIAETHDVGLHFDASFKGDLLEEFNFQRNLISNLINKEVKVFSYHRPATYGFPDLYKKSTICTYDNEFFKEIPYVSDSAGNVDRAINETMNCIRENLSFQLLIHPIWWVNSDSLNPIDNVIRFKRERSSFLENSYKLNCKIF